MPADSAASAAALASVISRLGSGWLECEDCSREFDSAVWGRTCPDCGFVNPVEARNLSIQAGVGMAQVMEQVFPTGTALPSPGQISENPGSSAASAPARLPSVEQSLPSNESDRWPFCYIVICMGLLTFLGSFTLALWWSFTRNDVSGGFTMAAYIVAIGGLPLASMQMRHNHRCHCWKNKGHTRPSELESM